MRSFFLFLLMFTASLAANVNPLPAPRSIKWGKSGTKFLAPQVNLQSNVDSIIIKEGFSRTLKSIRSTYWAPEPLIISDDNMRGSKQNFSKYLNQLSMIRVNVSDDKSPLQFGVNESYSLKIDEESNVVVVNAQTIWGALHAFSTLEQLFIYDELKQNHYIEASVDVEDEPLYPHRGIMIDSARNYLSVEAIISQIDMMALSKLNSLHWHISDTASWALKLTGYPQMIKDAFSKHEIFTKEEVQYIVEYAMMRGVRVIPEVDMPGHSSAGWVQINQKFDACPGSDWLTSAAEPPPGQLDFLQDGALDVIKNVYDEISSLFKDNVFHVGADEVNANCYMQSKNVRNWLKQRNSTSVSDLVSHWIEVAVPMFRNTQDRKLTMWEDIVLSDIAAKSVPKDIVMQTWAVSGSIKNLTSQGYKVIASNADYLYLDCGKGGFVTNDWRYGGNKSNDWFNEGQGGSWCGPYKTWQRVYFFDPLEDLTEEESKRVVGIEAPLWSEQIDSLSLSTTLWPRAGALAELSWSGNKDSSGHIRLNEMGPRILNYRELLVAKGYSASILAPKYCLQHPYSCNMNATST